VTIALQVGFDDSGDLAYAYVPAEGEILTCSVLPMALRTSPLTPLQNLERGVISFKFILTRDDDTGLPVYEFKTPVLKIMTVFSEFVSALEELTQSLEMIFVSFQTSNQPGGFELQVQDPVSLKTSTLLKTGLGILSYTRGFQMMDFR